MSERGQGFQFTPMGIIPLGETAPAATLEPDQGRTRALAQQTLAQARPEPSPPRAPAPHVPMWGVPPVAANGSAGPELSGRDLVKMARTRLRELDKLVPRLVREREELRRLVDAARPSRKPRRASPLPPH